MQHTFEDVRQIVQQLPENQRVLLVEELLREQDEIAFSELQREVGEPEPGYERGFRKGVEGALADDSPGSPHKEAMKEFHQAILRARS